MATPRQAHVAADSVIHRPGATWSQFDLGSDFDVATLSVVAALDPTGEDGVVEELLKMFQASLETTRVNLEELRAAGLASGIRFEAHKLHSAAGQLGALRLARACTAIARYFEERGQIASEQVDGDLDALVHDTVSEIIRVSTKLRHLLRV